MNSRKLLEYVAGILPNLPHIQVELRALADKVDKYDAAAKQVIEAKPIEVPVVAVAKKA
jgi:hypothetical protein